MKGKDDVIKEFNQYVNMTAPELEKWLKSGDSKDAGWSKEDASGESVGHDSGRQIVSILKSNPKKDPKKYTEDQVEHMRRVVAYCKRHIAQEKGPNSQKSTEEVKKTKSYASLKNWGHDPLKKLDSKHGAGKAQANEKEDEEDEEEENHKEQPEKQAGKKRKATSAGAAGTKQAKKQDTAGTRKSQRISSQSKSTNGTSKKQQEENGANDAEEEEESRGGGKKSSDKKPVKGPKPGDTVSWNWGSGQPQGKVLDVKGEKATVTTKRGNKVSREGDPKDPAVVLDAGKSKAIKFHHELNET